MERFNSGATDRTSSFYDVSTDLVIDIAEPYTPSHALSHSHPRRPSHNRSLSDVPPPIARPGDATLAHSPVSPSPEPPSRGGLAGPSSRAESFTLPGAGPRRRSGVGPGPLDRTSPLVIDTANLNGHHVAAAAPTPRAFPPPKQASPGPLRSPRASSKGPGVGSLFRSGTLTARGKDHGDPGEGSHPRRESEVDSDGGVGFEEGDEVPVSSINWGRTMRWFLWVASLVLIGVAGYFTAVARRHRDAFAENTAKIITNPDLIARICFILAYVWLSYIVLDFLLEPLINAIKNKWTVGKTAANLKYYLDEMKLPLQQAVYFGTLMAAFAGIFMPYRNKPNIKDAYDWILRVLACILVFFIFRAARVAIVLKIFAAFSKQAYFEQIQEILLMNFVLSRLLEQAELEHQIRLERRLLERRVQQQKLEKNLAKFTEIAKRSGAIAAAFRSGSRGTPPEKKGTSKNLISMIRGAGDTAVANGTGTPEPSAPSTSGASLSLAPDPAAAPEPPPTLTSPPAPSPRRVTSQRQPPTTSNPGSSSYVRDPSGNPGASWPVPQPQPLPVTQPHFHRGVSTMSRGRGGGVVEGTEIGLVVRDMLHVGSKVIRGVKSGMHALTQRDREHGTPLGPDSSLDADASLGSGHVGRTLSRISSRSNIAASALSMDQDFGGSADAADQMNSNMEQAEENRARLDKLEKYALIDKEEADVQKLSKLEKRVREGLVTRFVWNQGRGRADITRDDRKRDADASALGKFLFRNLVGDDDARGRKGGRAAADDIKSISRDDFLDRLRGILMPANLSLSSAKARRARDRAEQAALKLLGFFDVNRDGTISSNDLQAAVQTIFRNFFKAQQRLEESNSLMATMHRVVGFICVLIGLILILWILKFDLAKLWLSVASIVLSLSFIFGQSVRTLYEAVVYVFFIHPFDVDDAVIVNGMFFRVKKIELLTTEMQSAEGERAYFPNHILANSVVLNVSRSEPRSEQVHVFVPMDFPRTLVKRLELHVEAFAKSRSDMFSGLETSVLLGLSRDMTSVRLTVGFTLSFPATDPIKSEIARSQLLLSVRDFLHENGVNVVEDKETSALPPPPNFFPIATDQSN